MSAQPARITAFDYSRYAKSLEREFHGRIRVSCDLPMREGNQPALLVRVYFISALPNPAGGNYERGVSGTWPSRDATTFFGLLFRLIIELEKLLSEEQREAQRAQQDRLPF